MPIPRRSSLVWRVIQRPHPLATWRRCLERGYSFGSGVLLRRAPLRVARWWVLRRKS